MNFEVSILFFSDWITNELEKTDLNRIVKVFAAGLAFSAVIVFITGSILYNNIRLSHRFEAKNQKKNSCRVRFALLLKHIRICIGMIKIFQIHFAFWYS
jgi:hypothetical protein